MEVRPGSRPTLANLQALANPTILHKKAARKSSSVAESKSAVALRFNDVPWRQ